MNAPEPSPGGNGLSKGQRLAVLPLIGGLYLFLVVATLPLSAGTWNNDTFMGGLMALIGANQALRATAAPIGWPRLVGLIAAVDAAALGVALLVAQVLPTTGWNEPRWLGIIVGFGGTFLIAWPATALIIRVMTRRADDARDDGKDPA